MLEAGLGMRLSHSIYTVQCTSLFLLQVCSAGSRLIVQEDIADQMVKKIKERMTHLRLGDSLDKVHRS